MALFLTACSSQDEPALPDKGPDEGVTPQVIFLFSPGGLGDMSYNDCILEGVQKFKKSHPYVDVFMYSPPDIETAERIFSDWLKRPGSNIPVIFTLASSDYEPLMERYIGDYRLTDNKRLLLFETANVYDDPRIVTFQVSMYGASFLSGVTASACAGGRRSLILLGSSADGPIKSARDGFIAGLGNNDYDVEYLADDWTGFVMANATYQKMGYWASEYGFIFPVAGGSNAGIYRYTREFDDTPLLAGMDIDQSGLSTRITGSVIKRLDVLVESYLTDWLLTGDMPAPCIYGLDSGYADWQLAPLYESEFKDIVEAKREEAIKKEKEYYGL